MCKRSDLKAKRLKSEAKSVGSLNYKGGVIGEPTVPLVGSLNYKGGVIGEPTVPLLGSL
jgi:hypothetical protein